MVGRLVDPTEAGTLDGFNLYSQDDGIIQPAPATVEVVSGSVSPHAGLGVAEGAGFALLRSGCSRYTKTRSLRFLFPGTS